MLQRKRRLSLLLLTLLQCTWKCCQVISEKIPVLRPLNFLREKEEACFLVALFKNVMYAIHLKRFIYLFAFLCVCVLNTCMSICVCNVCVMCRCMPPVCVQKASVLAMYSFDFDAGTFPDCGASILSSGVESSKLQPSSHLCPSWNGG